MTGSRNRLDRMAERVMDLDSPAYGDERERALILESSSFGMVTGLYVGFLGAFLASLFGLLLLPVVLLVMTTLPAAAASWYAKRRGIDLQRMAESAGARSSMMHVLGYGTVTMLTSAALAYTVFTGEPLIEPPSPDPASGEGFLGGMVQGAVVGGFLGALAATVGGVHGMRRAKRRREAARPH